MPQSPQYPIPDKLLPLNEGYAQLGVSKKHGVRREQQPQYFPTWPRRRIVGLNRNGANLYALSANDIAAYIASCKPVEVGLPPDPEAVARGMASAAATAARKSAVKSVSEPIAKNGKRTGKRSATRSSTRAQVQS